MGQATPLPGPLRLLPAYGFAGRERELAQLRALLPRTVGEGRRAALVAGEPGSGKSRLVRELAGELADGGSDRPVRRLRRGRRIPVRAVRHGPRGARPRRRRGAGRPRRARRVEGRPRAARPRPRPPARSTRRASSDADAERLRLHTAVTELLVAVSDEAPGAARARGPPLGRRLDAPSRPPPRPVGRGGAHAGRGDVPGQRGGRGRRALRRARGRVPHGRRGPDPARRPRGRRALGVHPPGRRSRADGGAHRRRPRPHRRQRLPRDRALARAGRRGSRRDRAVRGAARATRVGARDARNRSRGRQPAAPAALRTCHRAARARRGRRRRLRARDHPPRRRAGGGGPPGCGRRGRPRRAARRTSGNRARVPVHARAHPTGRRRAPVRLPNRRAPPSCRPGARARRRVVPTGQPSSPRSPITTRPLHRSATSNAPSR